MEHVSNRVKLGLMMSVAGILVDVCFMLIPTCSYCDPAQLFAVDDGKFPA